MHAVLQSRFGNWKLGLDLSAEDGLISHFPSPEEFDSLVEQEFADKWGIEPREGWRLIREGEVPHSGQKVFIPDFAFRHDDGRVVLMEVIGFWTPEYLEAKLATLRAFGRQPIVLAIAEPLTKRLTDIRGDIIVFKMTLKIDDVLARLRK